MRTAIDHGPCAVCGTNKPGLYWESRQHVLDFGTGAAPVETWDGEPIRCDECEYNTSPAASGKE